MLSVIHLILFHGVEYGDLTVEKVAEVHSVLASYEYIDFFSFFCNKNASCNENVWSCAQI